jgi:hypothetical protein
MSQLTDFWAPPPAVICDFGWYASTGTLFANLSYTINGTLYPPPGVKYQASVTPMNQTIVFDGTDSLALGIPKTLVPTGIQIISWDWDLGNGTTARGPIASTTYNYTTPAPDTSATLVVVDSHGRRYSTTHPLNLVTMNPIYASTGSVRAGSGRS